MKMKIHFKALDNTKKELETIEDFYRAKYNNHKIEDLDIFDSASKMHVRVINWKKDSVEYIVSVDYKQKIIAKATQPNLEWEPFEKDELKLFDLLNYDIHAIHKKKIKQEITDWVNEDNVFGPEIDYDMNKIKKFYLQLERKNKISNLKYDLFEDEAEPYLQLRFTTKVPDDNKKINNHLVSIDFGSKEISQLIDKMYMPFTIEELKFFDSLGFDLGYTHSYTTEQDLTDWIGKI